MSYRLKIASLGLSALVLTLILSSVFNRYGSLSSAIVDVSWPNCKVNITAQYSLGLVGVTGGLDFHPNPCLSKEASLINNYALYINTGYPGPNYRPSAQRTPLHCSAGDLDCLSYNYGYNAAVYAINYASKQNAHSRLWWLDVELDNSWYVDANINRANISGALAAIKSHVFMPTIGIYSYPFQWNLITKSWRNHLPVWVASGGLKMTDGQRACHFPSFTAGPVWLGQYTSKLDQNVTCSNRFIGFMSDQSSQ